jgi:hypothetical protein
MKNDKNEKKRASIMPWVSSPGTRIRLFIFFFPAILFLFFFCSPASALEIDDGGYTDIQLNQLAASTADDNFPTFTNKDYSITTLDNTKIIAVQIVMHTCPVGFLTATLDPAGSQTPFIKKSNGINVDTFYLIQNISAGSHTIRIYNSAVCNNWAGIEIWSFNYTDAIFISTKIFNGNYGSGTTIGSSSTYWVGFHGGTPDFGANYNNSLAIPGIVNQVAIKTSTDTHYKLFTNWLWSPGDYSGHISNLTTSPDTYHGVLQFNFGLPELASSSINNLTVSNVDCCTGYSCNIPINFTYALNGETLRTSIDQSVCNVFSTPYDEYTLDYYAGTPQYLTIAPQTAGRHYLCIVAGDSTILNSVDFVASSSNPYCISRQLPLPQFTCGDICQNIPATSTTWTNIACIAEIMGCYLIQPSSSSLSFILDNFNVLKTKFPANLFFSITDSIEAGMAATGTKYSYFGIPMWSTTTPHHFFIIPIITSSSVPNTIGQTNSEVLKLSLIYAFYGLVAFYIILRLKKK